MSRLRPWYLGLLLISGGLSLVSLSQAKSIPTQESMPAATLAFPLMPVPLGLASGVGSSEASQAVKPSVADHWEHVNKSCLSPSSQCDESVNLQQLLYLERNMQSSRLSAATVAADPCDNFYQYACGNWESGHPGVATMMDYAANEITATFVHLFEQKLRTSTEASQSELWSKMLKYYNSCLHLKKPVTLKGYLTEMQNFRLFDEPHNWVRNIGELSRYGYASHFLQVQVNHLNATHSILNVNPHIDDEKLEMSVQIYDLLKQYTSQSYHQIRAEFQVLENTLQDIVYQAMGTSESSAYMEIYMNLTRILTLRELSSTLPEIDWNLLFSLRLDRPLEQDEQVSVVGVEILRKIANYVNKPENTQVAFLYTLARFLSHIERLPHKLVGVPTTTPETCIRHMRKTLYLPMTYLIDEAVYASRRDESDRVIREVFAKLKQQFALTLDENRMKLQPEDLDVLKLKLIKLRLNVGNIPVNMNMQLLTNHMRDLMVSDNFYGNHLAALQHSYSYHRHLLSNVQSPIAWRSFNYHMPDMPDNVDGTPYYYCLNNMIIIPHAYLQRPFYDEHFWPGLLYGDLANTLGHELMHAFDSTFLEFDAFGNYNRTFYRRIETNSEFSERLECLGNDTKFLTERIADLSGSRLALNTFMRDEEYRNRNGKIYFLQFAQFFCSKADESTYHEDDPDHDPGSKRLIYALQQMPEFGEVFNCPANSGMTPQSQVKCELW